MVSERIYVTSFYYSPNSITSIVFFEQLFRLCMYNIYVRTLVRVCTIQFLLTSQYTAFFNLSPIYSFLILAKVYRFWSQLSTDHNGIYTEDIKPRYLDTTRRLRSKLYGSDILSCYIIILFPHLVKAVQSKI